jgi:hypothetical protein
LNAVRRGHEQEFGGLVTYRGFENPLPIVAALEPENVGKDLVAKRRELGPKPEREGVVFRAGVADEQRLTRLLAHDSFPDSRRSLEGLPREASCKITR